MLASGSLDGTVRLWRPDGAPIRTIKPEAGAVFKVAWSPDGSNILFSGVRTPTPPAPPEPPGLAPAPPDLSPSPAVPNEAQPAPTAAPIIPSTQTFRTEQVYVGDRDGYNLRPLTQREGLIYFQLEWSPDGQQVAALACREDEWEARRNEGLLPAGRPRLVTLEGQERLLDDRATPVAPVWSPDGTKVATAFDYDVAVYDALGSAPTGAGLSLSEPLRTASVEYDTRVFKKAEPQGKGAPQGKAAPQGKSAPQPNAPQPNAAQPAGGDVLISMNPFVRLEWTEPATLYAQTAFVRFYSNDPLPTFKYTRWHRIRLSPQAAVLGSMIERRRAARFSLASFVREN
jgi:hypothetical protein